MNDTDYYSVDNENDVSFGYESSEGVSSGCENEFSDPSQKTKDNLFPTNDDIEKYIFDTVDKAKSFYQAYASHHGFDIKRASGHKIDGPNGKPVVHNRQWACTRAGHHEGKRNNDGNFAIPVVENSRNKKIARPRSSKRCGCQATFKVVRDRCDHLYRVSYIVNDHNHPLATTPEERSMLKSNRYISAPEKSLLSAFNQVGMRTRDAVNVIELMSGGPNIDLTENKKAAYNYVTKQENELVKEGDINTALGFLEAMKMNDPDMFYDHKEEDDNTLSCVFWANGFSRALYALFGEIVVFDSTYNTNGYRFRLVIFSGVDNHLKTCVFGTALLRDETKESYTWLLQVFLRAMGEKKPQAVLTDQDKSMQAAIAIVFGKEVKHRVCCWHLVRNCTQNIKKKGFQYGFGNLIKRYLSVEEFEREWMELMSENGLQDNKWVQEAYAKRENWAEAYFRGHFMAMMRSTQRAESMNSVVKAQKRSGSKITTLLTRYHLVLARIQVEFLSAQRKSELSVPPLSHNEAFHALEKKAASIYTAAAFLELQNEISGEQSLKMVAENKIDGGLHNYSFKKYGGGVEQWHVAMDVGEGVYSCSCLKLESDGLPCRHLFAAFKDMEIIELPPECIRQRWTTSIGKNLKEKASKALPALDPQRKRFLELFKDANHECLVASQTENATQNCKKRIRISTNLAEHDNNVAFRDESHRNQEDNIFKSKKFDVSDPPKVSRKGARRGEQQHCSLCAGVGHKKGTCEHYFYSSEDEVF